MALPDGFFWGGGTSAVSAQGAARRSDQIRWEFSKGRPRSGGGTGFSARFEQDLTLFAELGLDHVRIEVDWARIEPFAGQIDGDELEQVEQQFMTAVELGLHPWATLHQLSLPGWFSDDTDGFRKTDGPSIHWSRHVDRVAELLDGIVVGWVPIDDPIGWALRGHHLGSAPPGLRSAEKARDAVEGIIEATFEAWKLLSSGSAPVLGSFGLPTLHSVDHSDDGRVAATRERDYWDQVIWQSWIGAVRDGELRLPWKAVRERPDFADAFDAIGVGAVPPLGVTSPGDLVAWPEGARRDGSGFSPDPAQVGEMLHRIAELLPGRDLVVTQLGVATNDDGWREDLHLGWLDEIARATDDGISIRGALFDPLIDGYEPDRGFAEPRGLITVDREPKPSFKWIDAQIRAGRS